MCASLLKNKSRKSAFTLLELLVVLGVLAVLLCLLVPAIQNVRTAGLKSQNSNSVRQALVAIHNYAGANQELLPSLDGNFIKSGGRVSLICALCPFLEADHRTPPALIRFKTDPSWAIPDGPLFSPGQGPATEPPLQESVTSLAFNPLVFAKNKRLHSAIPDGASNTLGITEHFGLCGQARFDWRLVETECLDLSMKKILCKSGSSRRATFSDRALYEDVYPVTESQGASPVTRGSKPLNFQVLPSLGKCDPSIPQSSVPGGIVCGFVDGSVRLVGQGVLDAVFWGSVTPDRGEALAFD